MYSPRQLLALFLFAWYCGVESWGLVIFSFLVTYAALFCCTAAEISFDAGYEDLARVMGYCFLTFFVTKLVRVVAGLPEGQFKTDAFTYALSCICLGVFLGLFDFMYTNKIKIRQVQ